MHFPLTTDIHIPHIQTISIFELFSRWLLRIIPAIAHRPTIYLSCLVPCSNIYFPRNCCCIHIVFAEFVWFVSSADQFQFHSKRYSFRAHNNHLCCCLYLHLARIVILARRRNMSEFFRRLNLVLCENLGKYSSTQRKSFNICILSPRGISTNDSPAYTVCVCVSISGPVSHTC